MVQQGYLGVVWTVCDETGLQTWDSHTVRSSYARAGGDAARILVKQGVPNIASFSGDALDYINALLNGTAPEPLPQTMRFLEYIDVVGALQKINSRSVTKCMVVGDLLDNTQVTGKKIVNGYFANDNEWYYTIRRLDID
jgi:hypothetical protein